MRKQNLTGNRFGQLIVMQEGIPIKDGQYNRVTWECLCDCGNTTTVRANTLKSGLTKSCGCLAASNSKNNTCPIRTNICEVCNKEFQFKSPLIQKTCSAECNRIRRSRYAKSLHQSKRGNLDYFITQLFNRTKTRSKNINVSFDLDIPYLYELLKSQDGKCRASGIDLEFSVEDGLRGRSPWSPSLDRIDSSNGYTKNNVQFVCLMYNLCKSTWTHEQVMKFVKIMNGVTYSDDGIPIFPVGVAIRDGAFVDGQFQPDM